MSLFGSNAEMGAEIQRRLMVLAHRQNTDVEGVVSWLASSYNPEDALGELLR